MGGLDEPHSHDPEREVNTTMSAGGAYDDLSKEKNASRDGSEGRNEAAVAVLENSPSSVVDSPATQIIGVMILEFGVLLHRYGSLRERGWLCDVDVHGLVCLSA